MFRFSVFLGWVFGAKPEAFYQGVLGEKVVLYFFSGGISIRFFQELGLDPMEIVPLYT